MEIAVLVLAVAVLVLGLLVFWQLLVSNRSDASLPSSELVHLGAASPPTNEGSRNQMEVVATGQSFELRLSDKALMQLEPIRYEMLPSRTALSGTYAQWLGALLDNPRVLEFIAGPRWVLAKVPDAIRQGGYWMALATPSRPSRELRGRASSLALQTSLVVEQRLVRLPRSGRL